MMCLVLLIVVIFPQDTSAGVFSFVNNLMGSDASASSDAPISETKSNNSQTMALLQAAVNTDPNPNKANNPSIVDDSAIETASGPSGTALEVESKAGTDKVSVYVVRDGDTLSSIAKMFDVTPNTILWANDLKSSKDLKTDQQLVILPISGLKYTVKKGDTLKSIATKYNGNVDDIVSFNGLASNATLSAGDQIIIPDGEASDISITPSKTKSANKVTSKHNTRGGVSGYFMRPTNGVKTQGLHGKYHTAVDLASPVGTTVHASAAGTIIVAKMGGWNGGYGNYIVIQHGNGLQSLYAHLSQISVSSGENVGQGDVIGNTGDTGNSTGPHLHFEILGGARYWNPFN